MSTTLRARRIRYALAAVKGVGRQAIEALIEARGDKPFRDLADFARRINPRSLNKRTLENLIAAGALDELEPDRAKATASVDAVMSLAQQSHEAANRRHGGHVRRRRPRPTCSCASRPTTLGRRPSACSTNTTPSASSCQAIRSTNMATF